MIVTLATVDRDQQLLASTADNSAGTAA